MILPGMGIVSEVIPCFARKNLFGYTFVALSSFGIACLGFLVWAHHMFVAGISMYAAMVFSVLSFLVAVPSAIKVFNWTATLYKGSISFEAPMLYALGFVCLFTAGGLTGLFLASLGMDMHVHDTYFVIAHFHFIMVGGMVMAYMAGLHYWWPKMTGRHVLGVVVAAGGDHHLRRLLPDLPAAVRRRLRRHAAPLSPLSAGVPGLERDVVGRRVDPGGRLRPAAVLPAAIRSRYGQPAGPNPWQATGLEWQTPSPPPTDNFAETPVVVRGPYEYHVEKAQNEL